VTSLITSETNNCRCVKHGCHLLADGRRPEMSLRSRDPASPSRLTVPSVLEAKDGKSDLS